jgi:hypothetical protein
MDDLYESDDVAVYNRFYDWQRLRVKNDGFSSSDAARYLLSSEYYVDLRCFLNQNSGRSSSDLVKVLEDKISFEEDRGHSIRLSDFRSDLRQAGSALNIFRSKKRDGDAVE